VVGVDGAKVRDLGEPASVRATISLDDLEARPVSSRNAGVAQSAGDVLAGVVDIGISKV
jgi:hypothetical protein